MRSAKVALRPRRYCRLDARLPQQVGFGGKDVRAFGVRKKHRSDGWNWMSREDRSL